VIQVQSTTSTNTSYNFNTVILIYIISINFDNAVMKIRMHDFDLIHCIANYFVIC